MFDGQPLARLWPRTLSPLAIRESGEGGGDCRLLGPFALLVQGALGALALLSLVYKRFRERPQRPLLVWWFDVSKQLFGSVLVHIANLLMSMLSAGELQGPSDGTAVVNTGPPLAAEVYQPNPCSFYLLNLAIDTTLGIPILIGLLSLLFRGARHTALGDPPDSLQSGYYGSPPRWGWWFKQSLIYFLGLLGMKFCVLLIFTVFPFIVRVGDWALRWTEGDERIQVFFVMLFFPLIMNGLQYWIIDGFIKRKDGSEKLSQDEPTDDAVQSENEGLISDDEDADGSKQSNSKARQDRQARVPATLKQPSEQYGAIATGRSPLLDGDETPTTIVGSAKDDQNSHNLQRISSTDGVHDRKHSPAHDPSKG